jgi:hypothetical protein
VRQLLLHSQESINCPAAGSSTLAAAVVTVTGPTRRQPRPLRRRCQSARRLRRPAPTRTTAGRSARTQSRAGARATRLASGSPSGRGTGAGAMQRRARVFVAVAVAVTVFVPVIVPESVRLSAVLRLLQGAGLGHPWRGRVDVVQVCELALDGDGRSRLAVRVTGRRGEQRPRGSAATATAAPSTELLEGHAQRRAVAVPP